MKFKFGKRKIQKIGYTRLISLPLDWLRNRNLEAGSPLEIEMDSSGNLVISGGEKG